MFHRIVIVEDSSSDYFLIKLAIREVYPEVDLIHFADGEEAIFGLCRDSSIPPDLILLDLNLPKVTGLEVLAAIKRNTCIPWVPVVILSTSQAPADRERAKNLGANDYVPKPSELQEFLDSVKNVVMQYSDRRHC